MPERQRRAVVGDRDHRLERLVQRELGARLLERAVGGDVLWLDDDLVVVVELAGVDAALGFGQNAELVERGRDHLFVRVVREERRRYVRIADPDTGATRKGRDQAVELTDQVGRARLGAGGRDEAENQTDRQPETDPAHPAEVTASSAPCFRA